MSQVDKSKLKTVFLRKRKTLTHKELDKRNANLLFYFDHWIQNQKTIQNIHTFLPIEEHNEVDTRFFVKYLKEKHYSIILSKSGLSENSLTHYLFEDTKQLACNRWGIKEPQHGQVYLPEQIDLVLVPLIVFDRNGHRIGYGKGYYDRFLSECRQDCAKIGLSFSPPLDHIPYIESHDISLDYCITPYGIYDFT